MTDEALRMNEIEIVPVKPEDARGIQDVVYSAWLKTYPNKEYGISVADIVNRWEDKFSDEHLAKNAARYSRLPDNETMLVARKSNRVVGVCSVFREEHRNQLQRIYIHPDEQGQGIGTQLWSEARRHLDLMKDTYVEVVEYNTQAIRFYQKLGFEEIRRGIVEESLRFKSGAVMPYAEMVMKAGGVWIAATRQ